MSWGLSFKLISFNCCFELQKKICHLLAKLLHSVSCVAPKIYVKKIMNQYLLKWLWLCGVFCAAFMSEKLFAKDFLLGELTQSKHHSFSHSSSPHHLKKHKHCKKCDTIGLPNANKIKAPPYITSKNGFPVMQVGVLNRTSRVSSRLLKKTLKVVTKQVTEHFAHFYGIYVNFTVFEDQNKVDWKRYVPLIIDDLLPIDRQTLGFHAYQDEPANGFPVQNAVFNPPDLPVGTPYMVIPLGNANTNYGIIPASMKGDPTIPPTFRTIFSWTVSHEVLETLHDYTALNQQFNFIGNIDFVDAYIREVCDPVQFTPGYVICGLNVSNFVLPSYWTNDLPEGPYDFLNTVQAPLVPFAGLQGLIRFGPCGGEFLGIVSLPPPFGNPSLPFFEDNGPVFSTSCSDGATVTFPREGVIQGSKWSGGMKNGLSIFKSVDQVVKEMGLKSL